MIDSLQNNPPKEQIRQIINNGAFEIASALGLDLSPGHNVFEELAGLFEQKDRKISLESQQLTKLVALIDGMRVQIGQTDPNKLPAPADTIRAYKVLLEAAIVGQVRDTALPAVEAARPKEITELAKAIKQQGIGFVETSSVPALRERFPGRMRYYNGYGLGLMYGLGEEKDHVSNLASDMTNLISTSDQERNDPQRDGLDHQRQNYATYKLMITDILQSQGEFIRALGYHFSLSEEKLKQMIRSTYYAPVSPNEHRPGNYILWGTVVPEDLGKKIISLATKDPHDLDQLLYAVFPDFFGPDTTAKDHISRYKANSLIIDDHGLQQIIPVDPPLGEVMAEDRIW